MDTTHTRDAIGHIKQKNNSVLHPAYHLSEKLSKQALFSYVLNFLTFSKPYMRKCAENTPILI